MVGQFRSGRGGEIMVLVRVAQGVNWMASSRLQALTRTIPGYDSSHSSLLRTCMSFIYIPASKVILP